MRLITFSTKKKLRFFVQKTPFSRNLPQYFVEKNLHSQHMLVCATLNHQNVICEVVQKK